MCRCRLWWGHCQFQIYFLICVSFVWSGNQVEGSIGHVLYMILGHFTKEHLDTLATGDRAGGPGGVGRPYTGYSWGIEGGDGGY